ncbi:DUF1512 domain-containing protein [Pyrofollis japonicus]|uniref:DUF1512 domain-containing protein n=1 Tax=Pyrofollis japonicus TaxID=3060460 RepID=UPI00295BE9BC|nr:DUF1512 domain-containing protein [Pyrofollis japonicus]BEP17044.1 DUF1512 domain-containing protein [Pyrofollis japonicus]
MANATNPWFGGGSDLATWIIAISILISTILSIFAFLGIAQGFQLRIWKAQIESRLRVIESYRNDVRDEVRKRLEKLGARNIDRILETVLDYFVIGPVDIEPTDIVRRLERVLRTEEERIEALVARSLPKSVGDVNIKNVVTLLAIANALNTIYKYIRHILLTGIKTRNALLVAQLWMMLPLFMRIAKAYYDASRVIARGIPIGDAAGPLAAYKLMNSLKRLEGPIEIVKDTIYSVHEFENRRIIVVKAKGPGSTVGRPGEAVEKIIEKLSPSSIASIITIDAALKMEGEPTGSVAEGTGVAMGDPGPEKIRIERIAVKYQLPLYAIAIKMGLEEAITALKKEVVDGVNKAIERAKMLILEETKPGDTVIIVGVGNTLGVAQ